MKPKYMKTTKDKLGYIEWKWNEEEQKRKPTLRGVDYNNICFDLDVSILVILRDLLKGFAVVTDSTPSSYYEKYSDEEAPQIWLKAVLTISKKCDEILQTGIHCLEDEESEKVEKLKSEIFDWLKENLFDLWS